MNKEKDGMNKLFYAKCKEAKLKITPQRITIYESLWGDKGHPSAEVIFKRVRKKIPNISFDTVNRTLLSFVGADLIRLVRGHGRPKRFDPNLEGHHHFKCNKCNRIIDIYDKNLDALEIPKDIKRRFIVTGKRLVIEGICDSCRK